MDMPAAWPCCKLFVGGLSARTTKEILHAHFSTYGRLVDAVVMSHQGRPRCFGFVTYEDPAAAVAALAAAQWLDGRFVDVKNAVREPQEERAPNKIFVGGLPQDTAIDELRACFAKYGPIVDAVVMADRRTRRSRGFGFIRFASGVRGAKAAEAVLVDSACHRLGDKWVEVKRATPAPATQEFFSNGMALPGCAGTPTAQDLQAMEAWQDFQDLQQHAAWESGLHAWGGATGMDPFGLYGAESMVAAGSGQAYWDPEAFSGAAHDWSIAAGADMLLARLSLSPHAGGAAAFDPQGLDTTPTNYSSIGESPEITSISSHSSEDEHSGENWPGAANRAFTPPPGALRKRPPGLGIQASPMKVECSSNFVAWPEGATFQDFKKMQPRRFVL